jgi:coenzyme Q-binding protein COQ10
MHTVDAITVRADLARVFALAADVERWPMFLPHYRWVRVLERRGATRTVEMAAWRPFGPLRYPAWWVSEMRDQPPDAVRYRHLRGITRGMDVEWRLAPEEGGVRVTIVHDWAGPRWPVIGAASAKWVIGPVFVHGIARRTLAGLKRQAEAA